MNPGPGGDKVQRDGAGRRTGRRVGESTTREAILEAARSRFAEHGYDRATIRGIAGDAGVDPALVHHYFGTKEKLFVAALRFPAVPSEVLGRVAEAGPERLGETFVRTILGFWEAPETREQSLALLRSAVTNEQAAAMLRGFVERAIVGAVAGIVADRDAAFRASLVASQMFGVGMARFVLGLEPLKSASTDDLVAAVAPTVQRYLTGDVRSGEWVSQAGSPQPGVIATAAPAAPGPRRRRRS